MKASERKEMWNTVKSISSRDSELAVLAQAVLELKSDLVGMKGGQQEEKRKQQEAAGADFLKQTLERTRRAR